MREPVDSRIPPALRKLELLCAQAESHVLRHAANEIAREESSYAPGTLRTVNAALVKRHAVKHMLAAAHDPPRPRIRFADSASLLALVLLVAAVYAGIALRAGDWRLHATQRAGSAVGSSYRPAATDLPKIDENLAMTALDELVRLADHPDSNARRRAVEEIARRGEAEQLLRLREHRLADVRALVPLAALRMGPTAHALIPRLAEGLSSDEPEVWRATVHSLRVLVARYGAYREPAVPLVGRLDLDSR